MKNPIEKQQRYYQNSDDQTNAFITILLFPPRSPHRRLALIQMTDLRVFHWSLSNQISFISDRPKILIDSSEGDED